MSEEKITCSICGKLSNKGNTYCIHCGRLLEEVPQKSLQEAQEKISDIFDTSSVPSGKKISFRIGDLSWGYKVLAFFIIVAIVDLLASIIILPLFKLPLNTYFMIFVGFYFAFMIIVGLIWAASANADFANELLKGCAALFGIILLLMIIIPLYIVFVLPGVLESIDFSNPELEALGQRISEAISEAFENFFRSIFEEIGENIKSSWSDAFEDVEVPGFEPFLFIGLFVIISFGIMYTYHLKAKRANNINQ
ncbi:MAG: hypothetical protein ACFFA0_04970 [Promethearchaeota archaeon]